MAGAGCFNFDGVLTLCRELWAAADELNNVMRQRDSDAGVALKQWQGPHADTFKTGLEADEIDETRLVRLLRSAADDWAQAWVYAMNDENRARHDKAVDGADSMLEWLPGFSDRPVTGYTSITAVPSGPDFEATGELYINTES